MIVIRRHGLAVDVASAEDIPQHDKVHNITIDIPKNVTVELSFAVLVAVLVLVYWLCAPSPVAPNHFLYFFYAFHEGLPSLCQDIIDQFGHRANIVLQEFGSKSILALLFLGVLLCAQNSFGAVLVGHGEIHVVWMQLVVKDLNIPIHQANQHQGLAFPYDLQELAYLLQIDTAYFSGLSFHCSHLSINLIVFDTAGKGQVIIQKLLAVVLIVSLALLALLLPAASVPGSLIRQVHHSTEQWVQLYRARRSWHKWHFPLQHHCVASVIVILLNLVNYVQKRLLVNWRRPCPWRPTMLYLFV